MKQLGVLTYCCMLQARNVDQKRLWCQQLKKSIIDNYEAVIPDKAKQLVMSVGADSAAEGLLLISSELLSLLFFV